MSPLFPVSIAVMVVGILLVFVWCGKGRCTTSEIEDDLGKPILNIGFENLQQV